MASLMHFAKLLTPVSTRLVPGAILPTAALRTAPMTLFASPTSPLTSITLPSSSQTAFSTTTTHHSPADWKLGRLNHLAIVVPDMAQSVAMYRDMLGAQVSEPEDLPEHGVTVVFINLGNTKLELLHPLSPDSPVANFLTKNKAGGLHHVCIEVDNIEKAMEDLKAKKVRLLSSEPKIGAHGNPVVFLHPKDCNGVLTELEEVAFGVENPKLSCKRGSGGYGLEDSYVAPFCWNSAIG